MCHPAQSWGSICQRRQLQGLHSTSIGRLGFRAGPPQPLVPGHKVQPKAVVVDFAVVRDRARFDVLHFLRHNSHIDGAVVALVAEAIEFAAVVEPC